MKGTKNGEYKQALRDLYDKRDQEAANLRQISKDFYDYVKDALLEKVAPEDYLWLIIIGNDNKKSLTLTSSAWLKILQDLAEIYEIYSSKENASKATSGINLLEVDEFKPWYHTISFMHDYDAFEDKEFKKKVLKFCNKYGLPWQDSIVLKNIFCALEGSTECLEINGININLLKRLRDDAPIHQSEECLNNSRNANRMVMQTFVVLSAIAYNLVHLSYKLYLLYLSDETTAEENIKFLLYLTELADHGYVPEMPEYLEETASTDDIELSENVFGTIDNAVPNLQKEIWELIQDVQEIKKAPKEEQKQRYLEKSRNINVDEIKKIAEQLFLYIETDLNSLAQLFELPGVQLKTQIRLQDRSLDPKDIYRRKRTKLKRIVENEYRTDTLWHYLLDSLLNELTLFDRKRIWKKCEYCGKLFIQTDGRQKFCPPIFKNKKSQCSMSANKKSSQSAKD